MLFISALVSLMVVSQVAGAETLRKDSKVHALEKAISNFKAEHMNHKFKKNFKKRAQKATNAVAPLDVKLEASTGWAYEYTYASSSCSGDVVVQNAMATGVCWEGSMLTCSGTTATMTTYTDSTCTTVANTETLTAGVCVIDTDSMIGTSQLYSWYECGGSSFSNSVSGSGVTTTSYTASGCSTAYSADSLQTGTCYGFVDGSTGFSYNVGSSSTSVWESSTTCSGTATLITPYTTNTCMVGDDDYNGSPSGDYSEITSFSGAYSTAVANMPVIAGLIVALSAAFMM